MRLLVADLLGGGPGAKPRVQFCGAPRRRPQGSRRGLLPVRQSPSSDLVRLGRGVLTVGLTVNTSQGRGAGSDPRRAGPGSDTLPVRKTPTDPGAARQRGRSAHLGHQW